jgi:hypothetical protein
VRQQATPLDKEVPELCAMGCGALPPCSLLTEIDMNALLKPSICSAAEMKCDLRKFEAWLAPIGTLPDEESWNSYSS